MATPMKLGRDHCVRFWTTGTPIEIASHFIVPGLVDVVGMVPSL